MKLPISKYICLRIETDATDETLCSRWCSYIKSGGTVVNDKTGKVYEFQCKLYPTNDYFSPYELLWTEEIDRKQLIHRCRACLESDIGINTTRVLNAINKRVKLMDEAE